MMRQHEPSLSALQPSASSSSTVCGVGGGSSSSSTYSARSFKNNNQNMSDEMLVANFRNVSLFHEDDMACLGIGSLHPWQLASAINSSNGFAAGSSDSSAPISPNSTSQNSMDPKKRHFAQFNHHNHHHHQTRGQRHGQARGQTRPNNRSTQNHQQQLNRLPKTPMNENYSSSLQKQHHSVLKPNAYHPGMRDLTHWLKKLRLHKYTPIFEALTYPQMMTLDAKTLETLNVTTGARKKIINSIEDLRRRPLVLRRIEKDLRNNEQCLRCAICTVRQMLWTPFMKFELHCGKTRYSPVFIDGLHVPIDEIPNENMPALLCRVVILLDSLIFTENGRYTDLEYEYQLTMFQIYDNILKNEQFTTKQQIFVSKMKSNARQYASPEELRRHRMGMASSNQCDRCHNAEVVNRDRLIEAKKRKEKMFDSYSINDVLSDVEMTETRHQPAMEPVKVVAPEFPSPFNFRSIWSADDADQNLLQPSTSISPLSLFPQYRAPRTSAADPSTIYSSNDLRELSSNPFNINTNFGFNGFLSSEPMLNAQSLSTGTSAEPSSPDASSKANSTGSGYSSSDSESSAAISPRTRHVAQKQSTASPPAINMSINALLTSPSVYSFLNTGLQPQEIQ